MKTTTDHIRDMVFLRHGLVGIDHSHSDQAAVRADIAEKTSNLAEMTTQAKDRLIMGTLRYGVATHALYDYRARLQAKLDLYDETGNQEYLVDAMNYCVLERYYSNRQDVFFVADDGESGTSKRNFDL